MGKPNAILEQITAAVAEALGAHDVATAEPIVARFRDAPQGTSGVAVTVRLRDPRHVPIARRVIAERFGSRMSVDVIHIA